ncbi:MAG: hypothetical protein BWX50_01578 [Euryarchaeota archaeon ADurb.Bin009]|nr:MAG: hypothetical protein BWX50_01578 [Euryarchaeota archaeon ADurb.Bin009]
MARAGKLRRGRQPRRSGSHDRHPFSGWSGHIGEFGAIFPLPVGHEPLERTYPYRRLLVAEDADSLALRLLGADPTADGREHVLLLDRPCSPGEVALGDLSDERRDIDADRATLYAERFFALQAPLGLGDRLVRGEAGIDLFEIPDPDVGRPVTHGGDPLRRTGTGAPRTARARPSPGRCRSAAAASAR